MPFYGNACIQTWVITALDESFQLLDDDEKIEVMDLFRDDEGWFDEDKWAKIAWDNYEDMLMEGINNDTLITAIKHSFLNEEEYEWELHTHMRGVFEEYEENLTKKTEEDEEEEEEEETDEQMKARGAMDSDGFVVCEHCGKGGGAHSSEDCPDLMREETCVKCKETKTEDWYYNTTDVKNAPVCEDCRDKDDAAKNLKGLKDVKEKPAKQEK